MSSRDSAPLLIQGTGPPQALTRVQLGETESDGGRREAFVQQLVHDHPEVIPMRDIEPAYWPLIPVCLEMSTAAGFVDNLWLTPNGGIVLGECKLTRNPQSRREVVAQALDYAQAISSWSYEDLERAAASAARQPHLRLWSLVEGQTELTEHEFVDAVQRRLERSRMMVLIIGDGIQAGAEALVSHLQLHAGFHAFLAMVDLSIWRMPSNDLLVVPRVPMRTTLIERGVVRIDAMGQPSVSAAALPIQTGKAASRTLSEEEFFEALAKTRPEDARRLSTFLDALPELGVIPEFRKSLVLRARLTPDATASAGYVDTQGLVWLSDAFSSAKRLGVASAGAEFLQAVARSVRGSVREYPSSPPTVLGPDGRTVTVGELLDVQEDWRAAIAAFVATARSAAS